MKTDRIFLYIGMLAILSAIAFYGLTKRQDKPIARLKVPHEFSTGQSEFPSPTPVSVGKQEREEQKTPTESNHAMIADPVPSSEIRIPSPERILTLIFSSDEEDRREGLSYLAELLEQNQGIDILEQMIESGDFGLCEKALPLMSLVNEKERITLILKGLDNPEASFRREFLTLARDLVEVDVNPILLKGLKDDDKTIQEETTDLYRFFLDKPLYQAAYEGLNHDDMKIRQAALNYLTDKHTVSSVTILLEALKSEFPEVVEGSGNALRFITESPVENNDYTEWKTWWDENKMRILEEQHIVENEE
ncbi:hypothetical protein JW926_16135 [Candidatus Sumerlaeota bacterium]|nr:hypothetical protein [Candidatus Sumerlaeota bacterium]